MPTFYNNQLDIQMRRKCHKLREFPMNGAKANCTYIGSEFKNYFVVGDSTNNIRLFDFQNDEELNIFSSHNNQNVQTEVTAVALSYCENQIFSGTNRGMINIWDMEAGKSSATLKGHSTAINCFGIYPEEPEKLASGSYDSTIKLWDVRQKNSTATLKGHTKQVNSIAISPDGNMLLSGSQDNSNRLWDFRSLQRPIFISNQHNGPIIKARFNPEDCFFATSSMDKTVKYFRCQQKCYGFASSTSMISTPVTGLCFSLDGKTLYTAANDVLKSWNMFKNGFLLQTFETNWKGVQDMTIRDNVVTAVSFAGSTLCLWVCDLDSKLKNNSRTSEQGSFVLPKIGRAGMQKGDFNLSQLQNIVGIAVQKVNNIEDKPTRDRDIQKKEEMQKKRQEQAERKRQEMEKKKEQMQRKKEQIQRKKKQMQMEKQRQRQRVLLQRLLKQKEERQKKEQERLRKLDEEKKEQQRLYQERLQRQKLIQQKVKETFQNHNNNLQNTLDNDMLESSTVLNLSTYVADSTQKEKLRQFELIDEIIKEKSKYQCILSQRRKSISPILSYWKSGKISAALDMLGKVNYMIKLECVTAILNTPLFKQGVSPEVGIQLTSMMNNLMVTEKNSTFVRGAMDNINTIVLLFKDELIKIKTFNPMTRVDLSREERLAKYDKLIDEFLNVFRQQRLKKYYERRKSGEQNPFCVSAFVLYKNLQEVLIKILPKQQPQLA